MAALGGRGRRKPPGGGRDGALHHPSMGWLLVLVLVLLLLRLPPIIIKYYQGCLAGGALVVHELEQLGEDGLERADVGELHVPLRPAGGEVRQPRLEVEDHLRGGGGRIQLCDIIIAAGGEVRQPRLEVEDHLRDGDTL
jgi:hypothetical protein